jgi:hypothetical protein
MLKESLIVASEIEDCLIVIHGYSVQAIPTAFLKRKLMHMLKASPKQVVRFSQCEPR